MAITRKPKIDPEDITSPNNIEELIKRGGSVASEQQRSTLKSHASVQLRIPQELLQRIDVSIKNRSIRTPRHTWLLEAILEKLSRDQE